jgi:hypothetical protein
VDWLGPDADLVALNCLPPFNFVRPI